VGGAIAGSIMGANSAADTEACRTGANTASTGNCSAMTVGDIFVGFFGGLFVGATVGFFIGLPIPSGSNHADNHNPAQPVYVLTHVSNEETEKTAIVLPTASLEKPELLPRAAQTHLLQPNLGMISPTASRMF